MPEARHPATILGPLGTRRGGGGTGEALSGEMGPDRQSLDLWGVAALAGARGLTTFLKPLSRDFGEPMGERRPIGKRPIAGAT